MHKYSKGGKFNQSNNDLKQNLNLIIEKELYPCVVFVFSRRECNELALNNVGLDALNSRERTRVKRFFKKSIERLDPEDRELYQVKELEFCLENGIGYHHAGLIPLLKEIVEILFADGLIKILFATTTFAIGLNMPARAVMFYKLKKFNGQAEEFLLPSEYLQMAGRAGRRGKDDKGYSLIYMPKAQMFMNQDVPNALQDMLNVKSGKLESKYKLTYRIILHVLSKDDGMHQLTRVMKSSFLENDSFNSKVDQIKKVNRLQEKLDNCADIECIKDSPDSIELYCNNLNELYKLNSEITSKYNQRQYIFPQVCEFTHDGQNYHIGTVMVNKEKGEIFVLTPDTVVKSPIEYEDTKSKAPNSIESQISQKNITKVFDYRLKTKVDFTGSMIKYSSKQQIVEELKTLDRNSKFVE